MPLFGGVHSKCHTSKKIPGELHRAQGLQVKKFPPVIYFLFWKV